LDIAIKNNNSLVKKRFKFYLYFIAIITLVNSCKKDIVQPVGLSNLQALISWEKLSYSTKSPVGGFSPRSNSSVSYDENTIYILGSGNSSNINECSEIWKFNASNNLFELMPFVTPINVSGPVSFMLDNKLYYGLGVKPGGFSNMISYLQGSSWKNTGFIGNPRSNSVSFVIGNKAYVGLGTDGSTYFNDFFEFDSKQMLWQKINDFPGIGRQDACAFVLQGKAYVGTGYNNGNYFKDFWQFDPAKKSWTRIEDLPAEERDDAVAFAFEKRAYVGTGWNKDIGVLPDFWEYNPITNKWRSAFGFEPKGRFGAVAFTNKGKAYVGTGNNANELNDFWVSK